MTTMNSKSCLIRGHYIEIKRLLVHSIWMCILQFKNWVYVRKVSGSQKKEPNGNNCTSSIKYIVHWLVICCKYMQNAQYTQFQDAQAVVQSVLPQTWLHRHKTRTRVGHIPSMGDKNTYKILDGKPERGSLWNLDNEQRMKLIIKIWDIKNDTEFFWLRIEAQWQALVQWWFEGIITVVLGLGLLYD
jgi:hypothetical protein